VTKPVLSTEPGCMAHPSFDGWERAVVTVDGASYRLEPIPLDVLRRMPLRQLHLNGRPLKIALDDSFGVICLWPRPDGEYSVEVLQ